MQLPNIYVKVENHEIVLEYDRYEFVNYSKVTEWITPVASKILALFIDRSMLEEKKTIAIFNGAIKQALEQELHYGHLWFDTIYNKWDFVYAKDPNDMLKAIL